MLHHIASHHQGKGRQASFSVKGTWRFSWYFTGKRSSLTVFQQGSWLCAYRDLLLRLSLARFGGRPTATVESPLSSVIVWIAKTFLRCWSRGRNESLSRRLYWVVCLGTWRRTWWRGQRDSFLSSCAHQIHATRRTVSHSKHARWKCRAGLDRCMTPCRRSCRL